MYKSFITKYRINSHSLHVEPGRYFNIAREDRKCFTYNDNKLEDEYHFILECNKFSQFSIVQPFGIFGFNRNLSTLVGQSPYLHNKRINT